MLAALNPLVHPVCFSPPRYLSWVPSWHEHIPFAMFLVDLTRPATLVELGTHYGDSYCAFLQAVDELELGTRCYAVDTWVGDPHSFAYGPDVLETLRAHHDPIYGAFSRLVQSTFDEALQHFPDHSIDLLHIDGYHTYEAARHDLDTWLPKLSPHAVVLLHDINLREGNAGVWRVWEEVRQRWPSFAFTHGHGLGVLGVGATLPAGVLPLFRASPEDVTRLSAFFFELGRRVDLTRHTTNLEREKGTLEARVQQAETALAGSEQALAESRTAVAERDVTVAAQRQALAEREEAGARQEETLARHVSRAEIQAARIETLEVDLRQTTAELRARDASARALASDLRIERDHLVRLQSGSLYRALSAWWRVEDFLFPPGTWHRRAAGRLARWMRGMSRVS